MRGARNATSFTSIRARGARTRTGFTSNTEWSLRVFISHASLRSTARSVMKRLDIALVERGIVDSREKAKRAIMAGQVRVNNNTAHKPSDVVRDDDTLALVSGEKYVSRGGQKLDHALSVFGIDVSGWTAIDLGASTGG